MGFYSILYNSFIPDNQDETNFPIYMAMIVLLWVIVNVVSNFFIPNYKIVGNFIFKSDSLILKKTIIPHSTIKRFSIHIKSFFGETPGSAIGGVGGLSIRYGTDNKISIRTTDNITYECFIKISSFRDMKTLEKISNLYEKNDIPINLRKNINK